ncbi:MAG: cation diffusion facilitator family transporter [Azoarcus sp.]|jgi:cobalt-zinc-cadmium efflux system protein|nr:cation diffusion facilitator family transporter [Azoarcus sp.]
MTANPESSHDHSHDDHGHDRHGHVHSHAASSRELLFAFGLTLAFAVLEAIAGAWSGSLALFGDAGHMLTDALALALAFIAARIALRPVSARHSYGLMRAETLAAFINGLTMLAIITALLWQAVVRLIAPRPVAGEAVTIVALAGLAVNLFVAWRLTRGARDLNTRAALLHVAGDALGSVAALASGLVIQFTGWVAIDPLLTMLICGLILASTLNLLRQAVHTLLEGVPAHLSLHEVGRAMAAAQGVHSVHDLHIWSLDSRRPALSAHLVITDLRHWEDILARERALLAERFGIAHVTLQPEPASGAAVAIHFAHTEPRAKQ